MNPFIMSDRLAETRSETLECHGFPYAVEEIQAGRAPNLFQRLFGDDPTAEQLRAIKNNIVPYEILDETIVQ